MEPRNDLKIKSNSFNLFNDESFYIVSKKLYYAYFQEIPEIVTVYHVNNKAVKSWVENELSDKIVKIHTKESFVTGEKFNILSNYIYVLQNNIIIDVEGPDISILYTKEFEKEARPIINTIRKIKKKEKKNSYIHIVTFNQGKMELQNIKCKVPGFKLNENYNDDLIKLDEQITTNLRSKDQGGLFLFHGLPGTGKTSYIKHLVKRLKKTIIFLPLQTAENIDSPSLVNLLLQNRNSVLVIEDAERLLASRDSGNNFGISTILNITDGLLSDGLGIKVICTFNTKLSNIDKALLRKGRLKSLYEFKPLEANKAKDLLVKLGVENVEIKEPMTLADIYNFNQDNNALKITSRNPIGFNSKVA